MSTKCMCATTKYVSVYCWSAVTEPTITPEMPPVTKMATKPSTKRSGTSNRTRPCHSVLSTANTWIPLGTATAIVATEKAARPASAVGVANMWWTQTVNEMAPMARYDEATQWWPTIAWREKVGVIDETMPSPGSNMM